MNVTPMSWSDLAARALDYWRQILADASAGHTIADHLVIAAAVLLAALLGAWLTAGMFGQPDPEWRESNEEYGRRVLSNRRRGEGRA